MAIIACIHPEMCEKYVPIASSLELLGVDQITVYLSRCLKVVSGSSFC